MAHELRVSYSPIAEAILRKELKLKDGIVFNNDYEGDPISGAVKIPVRDTEVVASDYNKATGLAVTVGATTYETMLINKDVAINELIDGYDAASVPDNLKLARVESGTYSVAARLDNDGASELIAGSTVINEATMTKDTIYGTIVDIATGMDEANVPDDGMRYLLVKPSIFAYVLKSPEFTASSAMGDNVKETGVIGQIAGFNVIKWNDSTANLAMIAGHPKFAARVTAWQVDVHVEDLSGSGTFIGASAVQGRKAYGHKVLNENAIRSVYVPGSLTIALAQGSTTGKTIATVTGASGSLKYKKNPTERATFDLATATYGGTALTSGTTEIAVAEGDIIEIVDIVSTKVARVGYVTVTAAVIK